MMFLTKKKKNKIIACLCANEIIFQSIIKDLKHDDFMSLIKAGENELDIAYDIGGIEAIHKIVTTAERYLKERRTNENGNGL